MHQVGGKLIVGDVDVDSIYKTVFKSPIGDDVHKDLKDSLKEIQMKFDKFLKDDKFEVLRAQRINIGQYKTNRYDVYKNSECDDKKKILWKNEDDAFDFMVEKDQIYKNIKFSQLDDGTKSTGEVYEEWLYFNWFIVLYNSFYT